MTKFAPASERLAELTAQIVAAYVGRNETSLADVQHVMAAVYQGLLRLGQVGGIEGGTKPAVHPKKSVQADYIICLEDGKKLKMLKRHLKTAYNLTPEQYRERWALPADYPMTAPNYAKRRSKLAKQIGLGTTPRKIMKKAA